MPLPSSLTRPTSYRHILHIIYLSIYLSYIYIYYTLYIYLIYTYITHDTSICLSIYLIYTYIGGQRRRRRSKHAHEPGEITAISEPPRAGSPDTHTHTHTHTLSLSHARTHAHTHTHTTFVVRKYAVKNNLLSRAGFFERSVCVCVCESVRVAFRRVIGCNSTS